MDSLGQRIKSARQAKRMQQGEIADLLGKSGKQVISNWENDKAEPSLTDLRKLAEVLEVTIGHLVDGGESVRIQEQIPAGKILMDATEVINMQRELMTLRQEKNNASK